MSDQFIQFSENEIDDRGVNYDYLSIMHYGQYVRHFDNESIVFQYMISYLGKGY